METSHFGVLILWVSYLIMFVVQRQTCSAYHLIVVSDAMRHLSTKTSILSDPSRVPEQAAQAVIKRQKHQSGDGGTWYRNQLWNMFFLGDGGFYCSSNISVYSFSHWAGNSVTVVFIFCVEWLNCWHVNGDCGLSSVVCLKLTDELSASQKEILSKVKAAIYPKSVQFDLISVRWGFSTGNFKLFQYMCCGDRRVHENWHVKIIGNWCA